MNALCRKQGNADISQHDDCNSASTHFERNKSNNNDSCTQCPDETLVIGNKQMIFNNWLCPESLYKIQAESNPECRDVMSMCDNLLHTEEQLAKEVMEYMFDHDVLNIRRRELLHLKWTTRVYDPIQSHILSKIRGKDFDNLLFHKRLLYNEFLAKSNRKEHILLDSVVQPVAGDSGLPLSLTARFGQLDDPLLWSERTRIEELRTGMQCVTGERLSSCILERLRRPATTSRQDGSELWANVNNNNIESTEHQRRRLVMNQNRNHSQVMWDCYYRTCPDEPTSSAVAEVTSSPASVAAAGREQDPQPCPQTHHPVSDDDDDNLQTVAQPDGRRQSLK